MPQNKTLLSLLAPQHLAKSIKGIQCDIYIFATGLTEDPFLPVTIRELEESVFALRYAVYIGEMGLTSPNADHHNKQIVDLLDQSAVHFVVRVGKTTVGCARINVSRFSQLGKIEYLYNMQSSPRHSMATGVGTKLMVHPDYRGYGIDALLFSLSATASLKHLGIREHFIDCRIDLIPYYERLGFRVCGNSFTHHETGSVLPMILDLFDYNNLRNRRSLLLRNNCVDCLGSGRIQKCPSFAQCSVRSIFDDFTNQKINIKLCDLPAKFIG